MPSKYRPQLFGWIDDLDKGRNYLSMEDDRLIYANNNYCVFTRKTLFDQLFYLFLSLILVAGFIFLSFFIVDFIILLIKTSNIETLLIVMIAMIAYLIGLYSVILPELYQNLFPRRGSPIVFNRQTQKVYVNESYFFNFKFWRNPLFFSPLQKGVSKNTIGRICKVWWYTTIHLMP
ncbi:hypothetical protein RCS94_07020 [Orbaceae bacterium ac157xtp]